MAQSDGDTTEATPNARSRHDEVTLATKVAFLSQRDSYPERPDKVEAIETRLSWVFLTPTRAWKLKKPLRYDHLDFSELAARRRDCEAEVRLNRPLAPGVYLSVEPLGLTAEDDLAIGASAHVTDYLVCMQRVPRSRCLEVQIRAGRIDPPEIDQAARALAAFYREVPAEGCVDPDALAAEADADAAALEPLPLDGAAAVAQLRTALLSAIATNRAELARRERREVHGDLRPQHVYLGEPPLFLDRLTFHRELRLMDPGEELAFLALDCERLGAAQVGERFLHECLAASGDEISPAVLACYRARRALLWALLSARHLQRGGPDRPWRELANEYLRLGLAGL